MWSLLLIIYLASAASQPTITVSTSLGECFPSREGEEPVVSVQGSEVLGALPGISCSTDADCPGDDLCINGLCVPNPCKVACNGVLDPCLALVEGRFIACQSDPNTCRANYFGERISCYEGAGQAIPCLEAHNPSCQAFYTAQRTTCTEQGASVFRTCIQSCNGDPGCESVCRTQRLEQIATCLESVYSIATCTLSDCS